MADKRRARQGSTGGNLTPQQAKDQLAIPVYALLTGQADLRFPGANLTAPSGLVSIISNPGGCANLRVGTGTGLPVWVNDKQWETAVVPVLIDPRFQGPNLIFTSFASNNLTAAIDLIGDALAQSFHDAGYGPLPT